MTSSIRHIESKANRRFRRLALNTVITLYFLIIAGGVVRSTGSGMGCPDWPRCFGRWVPPTEVGQLPANYKAIYGAKLKGEVEFNVAKTWTEYVNRLLGAFTGVMIFLTLLASVPFLKSGDKQIFYWSLAAFLLVGFQGWLGAKVVSFELKPVVITLHMLLAIVIVFILLYLLTWSGYQGGLFKIGDKNKSIINQLGLLALGLSFFQIIVGTQVREAIDELVFRLGYDQRALWVDELSSSFYVHRTFSIVVFAVNVVWIRKILRSEGRESFAGRMAIGAAVVMSAEILTGIILAYFGVPPFAQPMHLTLAILLIGLQFIVWLVANGKYLKKSKSIDLQMRSV